MVETRVPFDENGNPTLDDRYNAPHRFTVHAQFPNGVLMEITSEGRNGILVEGSQGRIFVNRAGVSGEPAERLVDDPLPLEQYRVYAHDNPAHPPGSGNLATKAHMANFFDCVRSRNAPISDVESQHRSATTCHLGNIAYWLGRPLKWWESLLVHSIPITAQSWVAIHNNGVAR